MTKKEVIAINKNSTFSFGLSGDDYGDLIVALSYAWENVSAEDKQYNDDRSAERVERVARVRRAVCNSFTIKEGK